LEQVQRVRGGEYSAHGGSSKAACARTRQTNSARWVAVQSRAIAEGIVLSPLYARGQAPAELAAICANCKPQFLFTSDAALGRSGGQGIAPPMVERAKAGPLRRLLQETAPDAPFPEAEPRSNAASRHYHLHFRHVRKPKGSP